MNQLFKIFPCNYTGKTEKIVCGTNKFKNSHILTYDYYLLAVLLFL